MITPSACDGCGAALRPYLRGVEDNLSREMFAVLRCPACGLGHTSPLPDDLATYYGERYYGNRHGFTANYCNTRRLKWLAQAVAEGAQEPGAPASGQPRRLLDIGCGDGSFMLAARAQDWDVYGTEVNPEPARAAGLQVQADLAALAKFAPFICITLWHSLEHVSDPRATLAELQQLLAPGGAFIIAVPDAGGLHAGIFRRHWFPLDVPRHIHHFSRHSLTKMLAGAGLEVTANAHQEIEYDWYSFNMSVLKTFMDRPVDCFEFLVGRPRRVSRVRMAAALLISAALVPVTLVMTMLGTVTQKGSTLILTARGA